MMKTILAATALASCLGLATGAMAQSGNNWNNPQSRGYGRDQGGFHQGYGYPDQRFGQNRNDGYGAGQDQGGMNAQSTDETLNDQNGMWCTVVSGSARSGQMRLRCQTAGNQGNFNQSFERSQGDMGATNMGGGQFSTGTTGSSANGFNTPTRYGSPNYTPPAAIPQFGNMNSQHNQNNQD